MLLFFFKNPKRLFCTTLEVPYCTRYTIKFEIVYNESGTSVVKKHVQYITRCEDLTGFPIACMTHVTLLSQPIDTTNNYRVDSMRAFNLKRVQSAYNGTKHVQFKQGSSADSPDRLAGMRGNTQVVLILPTWCVFIPMHIANGGDEKPEIRQ